MGLLRQRLSSAVWEMCVPWAAQVPSMKESPKPQMKRSKIIKGTYGSMSTPKRDIGGWKKVETENLQSTPLEEEVGAAPLVQRVPSEGM